MRKMLFAGAVLALLGSTTATAYAAGMTWGAEVYGAFNTYAMKDVNNTIDNFNAALQQNGISQQLDNITNGFTGGINIRMWANPTWQFNVGWEPIFASTDITVPGVGDAKIDAKAQAFQRLNGSTTRPAPMTPRATRKAVQALGVERSARSLGNARETWKRESAAESRKRASPETASAGGKSPGKSGG